MAATATCPPTPTPLFRSPALPSDLLHYIINHCSYPTTLLVCSPRPEFLSSLAQDLLLAQQHQRPEQQQQQPYHTASEPHDTTSQRATTDAAAAAAAAATDTAAAVEACHPGPLGDARPPEAEPPPCPPPPPPAPPQGQQQQQQHDLLTPSLSQLAATRHIRTVFVPTVSHLRAWLAVFSVEDGSRVVAPPPPPPPPPQPPTPATTTTTAITGSPPPPRLVVYNLLALHRHTSEWSAQGLGVSLAGVVEAGRRAGLQVLLAEELPLTGGGLGLKDILTEGLPVLGGRKGGADLEGWVKGRTVEVGRVMGRWFRFWEGRWWEG